MPVKGAERVGIEPQNSQGKTYDDLVDEIVTMREVIVKIDEAVHNIQDAHHKEIGRMQALLDRQEEIRAEQMELVKRHAEDVASAVSKKAVAEARDMREARLRGVMKRQAKRAGMTLSGWLEHCARNEHDPLKRDKSIPNHESAKARGGRPRKGGDTAVNSARALAEMHADNAEDQKRKKGSDDPC